MQKSWTYKLWKHLNKRYGKDEEKTHDLQCTVLNELVEVRRFLMLKEICPELVASITQKVDFPMDEKGEFFQNYVRWQMTAQDVVIESAFGYLFHWLDEVSAMINDMRYGYQSVDCNLEKFYKTAFRISQNNTAGSYLSNVNILWRLLVTMDVHHKAKEFLSFFLSKLDASYCDDVWMQVISLLLLLDDEKTAILFLEKFLLSHSSTRIRSYLAVADLANRNSVEGFELEASVFNQIEQNTNNHLLQKALKGKTVALIGNGPQERGKKQGEQIDSHDIVIRMNAYNLSDEYCQDYGSKADVWYRTFGEPWDDKYKSKGNPKYSILGTSFYCFGYPEYLIRRYAEELDKGHVIQSIGTDEFRSVLSENQIMYPSGGFLMAAWLKSFLPSFSSKDCFGLALSAKEEPSTNWARLDGTKNPLPFHNMFCEWRQFHKLFQE